MTQSKLVPLSVPWQLTSQQVQLDFHLSETKFEFIAEARILVDKHEAEAYASISRKDTLETIWRKHNLNPNLVMVDYAVVDIKFTGPTWTRIHPISFDYPNESLFNFDYSLIPELFSPFAKFKSEQYEKIYEKTIYEWATTGICPMPYAFEVYDSSWLEETQKTAQLLLISKPLHHYLFKGGDILFEYISTGFTWKANPIVFS